MKSPELLDARKRQELSLRDLKNEARRKERVAPIRRGKPEMVRGGTRRKAG